MNTRLIFAVASVLTLTLQAQVATVRPPEKGKIKWDNMDLGPFFSGTYKVKDTTSYKGVAIAVGSKEAPATILFDTELLRFHAAWEGGLAAFARGRGGLEGTIKADGDVYLFTGWATGIGAEVQRDPRPRKQGSLPGTKWRGISVHGDKTILSYAVGKQAVLELPGSEVADGVRLYTRTLALAAGSDVKQILLLDIQGKAQPGAAGEVLVEKDGQVAGVNIRGSVPGAKIQVLADGRIVLNVPALNTPATFEVALAAVPTADAAKLTTVLKRQGPMPDLPVLQKAGPARWGAPLITQGKLGGNDAAYVADEIPFPDDNPFKSWFRPGGHDFLADGTAVVANMSGDVWLVRGLDDKLEKVTWQRFASGLFQPLGCKVVDGKVYVLGRDQITRLHDLNNDGEADFYENFNNDCLVTDNYHEFALDLQTDAAGNFYYAKGSPWTPTNQTPHQGTMIKVSNDGSKLEVFATGLRAPNGLGMGPGDVLTCSDNQGHWMPANRLNIVRKGGFYGMVPAAHRELTFKRADGTEFKANPSSEDARKEFKTEFWGKASDPIPVSGHDLPLAWLPMDVDNSPGGEVWVPAGKWGPWAGKMLHMSYGKCTLYGVTQETVDGVEQGGFVKFPLKFNSGIQRARFSPKDSQLYMTGLSVWQSSAARDGCFYRVRYTGRPVTMPIGFQTLANGVKIDFTAPLDTASAADTANWSAEQWNYAWTGAYGSNDMSTLTPGKRGRDLIAVQKATVSPDGKSVTLELSDRVPAHTLRIKLNVKAADGTEVKQELNYTINRIPGGKTASTR